jgi:hypothetical protein
MSDAREKVAEVICGATSAGKLFPWAELTERERDAWRKMADAAIAAHLQVLRQGGYVVMELAEGDALLRKCPPTWNSDSVFPA